MMWVAVSFALIEPAWQDGGGQKPQEYPEKLLRQLFACLNFVPHIPVAKGRHQ